MVVRCDVCAGAKARIRRVTRIGRRHRPGEQRLELGGAPAEHIQTEQLQPSPLGIGRRYGLDLRAGRVGTIRRAILR